MQYCIKIKHNCIDEKIDNTTIATFFATIQYNNALKIAKIITTFS